MTTHQAVLAGIAFSSSPCRCRGYSGGKEGKRRMSRCNTCLGNAFEVCPMCTGRDCDNCGACEAIRMDPPSHPEQVKQGIVDGMRRSLEGYFDRKFDQGKLRYTLLPWDALEQVVQVLEYGAQKYSPDSWREVPNSTDRYLNALIRHVVAYLRGERIDKESRLPTLAHVATNALFLLGKRSNP